MRVSKTENGTREAKNFMGAVITGNIFSEYTLPASAERLRVNIYAPKDRTSLKKAAPRMTKVAAAVLLLREALRYSFSSVDLFFVFFINEPL